MALIRSAQSTVSAREMVFHILVVDREEDHFRVPLPNCVTYFLNDLVSASAYLKAMAFLYPLPQICSALKPFFMNYLLKEGKAENLVYLDSDVQVYSALDEAFELLQDHPALLTPQILTPSQRRIPDLTDLDALVSGAFNTGFIGVGRGQVGIAFLDWWARHLEQQFLRSIDRQVHQPPDEEPFMNQRWLDLVPALFPEILILRSEAYNVGSWNLHERDVAWKSGRYCVADKPLVCFNFSGLDPNQPEGLLQTFSGGAENAHAFVQRLCSDYSGKLRQAGHHVFAGLSSPFEHWDNGIRIPDLARKMLFRVRSEDCFLDPRKTALPKSYFSWLMRCDPASAPRLLVEIWNLREDVRCFFPDPNGQDRTRLLQWAVDFGIREMNLDPRLGVIFSEQIAWQTSLLSP